MRLLTFCGLSRPWFVATLESLFAVILGKQNLKESAAKQTITLWTGRTVNALCADD